MKKTMLLFTVFVLVLLSGCKINVVKETESKFEDAPELYPELTFVSVDELGKIMENDDYDYKVVIYNTTFDNHWWTETISNDLIPKWKSMDTTRIGLYLISIDCACLDDMNTFFVENNINLPRYVIRDSTNLFCSYNLSSTSDEWLRLTMITQHICNNACAITAKIPFFTTLILDDENNIKLIQTDYKGILAIVPMPFEMVPENPDEIDFKNISKYKITSKSKLYDAFYEE